MKYHLLILLILATSVGGQPMYENGKFLRFYVVTQILLDYYGIMRCSKSEYTCTLFDATTTFNNNNKSTIIKGQ